MCTHFGHVLANFFIATNKTVQLNTFQECETDLYRLIFFLIHNILTLNSCLLNKFQESLLQMKNINFALFMKNVRVWSIRRIFRIFFIQSEYWKMRTRITPNTDMFYAVLVYRKKIGSQLFNNYLSFKFLQSGVCQKFVALCF